tara:strand:+ start:52 stop:273 length:222 start_codon:yes stop_codon:yes gene_type:complete
MAVDTDETRVWAVGECLHTFETTIALHLSGSGMDRPNVSIKLHAPTLTHDFPGLVAAKHRNTAGLEKTLQRQG